MQARFGGGRWGVLRGDVTPPTLRYSRVYWHDEHGLRLASESRDEVKARWNDPETVAHRRRVESFMRDWLRGVLEP